MKIPEIINNMNVYKGEADTLIGVSGEVKLPDLSITTKEIDGAGILGTYETTVLGSFGAMDQEIPFRVLNKDVFSIMDPTQTCKITLRGAIQSTDSETNKTSYSQIRVVVCGRVKEFIPGTVKSGETMSASVKLSVTYMLIELGKKKMFELDKMNSVLKINNKDVLKKIKDLC